MTGKALQGTCVDVFWFWTQKQTKKVAKAKVDKWQMKRQEKETVSGGRNNLQKRRWCLQASSLAWEFIKT